MSLCLLGTSPMTGRGLLPCENRLKNELHLHGVGRNRRVESIRPLDRKNPKTENHWGSSSHAERSGPWSFPLRLGEVRSFSGIVVHPGSLGSHWPFQAFPPVARPSGIPSLRCCRRRIEPNRDLCCSLERERKHGRLLGHHRQPFPRLRHEPLVGPILQRSSQPAKPLRGAPVRSVPDFGRSADC